MQNDLTSFMAGAKVLTAEQASTVDLGPLQQLLGSWEGSSGWNVIAVPGPNSGTGPDSGSFILEIIPYKETLSFSPVVVALNRGPFVNGSEENLSIVGLLYEQTIISTCTAQSCTNRGFASGTQIHAETGLLLLLNNNVAGVVGEYNIARLSTIPHGNALLALGTSNIVQKPGNQFIPDVSATPFPIPSVGYADDYTTPNSDFPGFTASNPNNMLTKAIAGKDITSMTVLDLSTTNGTGGILNIPFIQTNINATQMTATFWIEELSDGSLLLQYTQNIYLKFPPTGSSTIITWPHVTVNTLTKSMI